MENLSLEKAEQFLNDHFKLFLDKQKEAGYDCEIIIRPEFFENSSHYFLIQFYKENEASKFFKIVC